MTDERKRSDRGRRYTDEFKREAVRLLNADGATIALVSKELGISAQTLCRWKKDHAPASAVGQRSLKALQKENARLREEIAFFEKGQSVFRVPFGDRYKAMAMIQNQHPIAMKCRATAAARC